MILTAGKAIKMLKKEGFIEENQVGSHKKFKKGDKSITIIYHSKDSEELGRKASKRVMEILK